MPVNFTPHTNGQDADAATFNTPLQSLDDAIEDIVSGDKAFTSALFTEQASAPSNPASGKSRVRIDTTGAIKVLRSSGVDLLNSRIATGTYTGDAAATKAVTGLGFQPKVLVIYRQTDASSTIAMKTNQDGTKAHLEDGKKYKDDHIISLDSDGFTVGDGSGDSNILNVSAAVYTYIALG